MIAMGSCSDSLTTGKRKLHKTTCDVWPSGLCHTNASVASAFRTANISPVGYESLSATVARIRAEIAHIDADNRKYFELKHHRDYEMVSHRLRQERVLELKAELEAMLQRNPIPDKSVQN